MLNIIITIQYKCSMNMLDKLYVANKNNELKLMSQNELISNPETNY